MCTLQQKGVRFSRKMYIAAETFPRQRKEARCSREDRYLYRNRLIDIFGVFSKGWG